MRKMSFEEWSFENLVQFYKEELTHIQKGYPITNNFSRNIRAQLYRKGIIEYKRSWDHDAGRLEFSTVLTPRAERVLRELSEEASE